MLPFLPYCEGNIEGIIMMLLLQYENIVEGSIFIIKDGNFDRGICLITVIEWINII